MAKLYTFIDNMCVFLYEVSVCVDQYVYFTDYTYKGMCIHGYGMFLIQNIVDICI